MLYFPQQRTQQKANSIAVALESLLVKQGSGPVYRPG